jgi:hypothetical protein
MKRRKQIIVILIIAAFAVLGVWGREQLKIDRCLDQGGRWNYERSACEMRTDPFG